MVKYNGYSNNFKTCYEKMSALKMAESYKGSILPTREIVESSNNIEKLSLISSSSEENTD